MSAVTEMNKVLFLCTGNYYRSRFSEYLFNDLAIKHSLNWRAESRGLALERGRHNVGAISKHARAGLIERGIKIPNPLRDPMPLMDEDLQSALKIIAVDESEHRPLLKESFPQWEDLIEYWLVHDIGETTVDTALGQLERHIHQLIAQLKQPEPEMR